MLRTILSLSFLLVAACCMSLQAQTSCASAVKMSQCVSKQAQADDTKASSTALLVKQEVQTKVSCQTGGKKAYAIAVGSTGESQSLNCDPSQCLPKDCDPKACDPTKCDLSKCLPSGAKASLAGNKQGVSCSKVKKEAGASI